MLVDTETPPPRAALSAPHRCTLCAKAGRTLIEPYCATPWGCPGIDTEPDGGPAAICLPCAQRLARRYDRDGWPPHPDDTPRPEQQELEL